MTTASPESSETLASFTPLTDCSADCTAVTQPPQVMPVTSRVHVASLGEAATKGSAKRLATAAPIPKTNALLFMLDASRVDYTTWT